MSEYKSWEEYKEIQRQFEEETKRDERNNIVGNVNNVLSAVVEFYNNPMVNKDTLIDYLTNELNKDIIEHIDIIVKDK